MTPGLITAIVSLVMTIGTIVAGLIAYGRSNRATESQVISVTVEAAEGVVNLVTAQLERSVNDYIKLSERLDKVEEALAQEQGRTLSLTMQLGKARKRITQLEDFVAAQGWTPPPFDGD
jgi:flagellar basal body-associated protein FliL